MKEFRAGDSAVGQRADVFVSNQFPEFTRSSLSRLFGDGQIMVNGQKIKAGHKLKVGDSIKVNTILLSAKPKQIKLPILYEDSNVIVINKPAGILTHAKGVINGEATIASFISPKVDSSELKGNRAGIVHRLDRATSGVIIAAKNLASLNWLQKQFSTRKVIKIYLAIVEGSLEKPAAVIDAPIGRNPKRPQTFKVEAGGRPAKTEYKLLKNITKNGSDYSLVELKPLTGRTHQLRVHLKYIGRPIVGDAVYGQGKGAMLLHAKSLELDLPDRMQKKFEAPIPKSFKEFEK